MMAIIQDIVAKIRLIVGRCVITAVKYKDGESIADLELLAGEVRRDVEFLQQFGFSSRPSGEVSGLALFVGGSRENGVVVGSRGYDKEMAEIYSKLEPGEVAVHSPFGSSIILKKDGSIVAAPKEGRPFRVEGDVNVVGSVLATVDFAALCVDSPAGMQDGTVHLTRHIHATAAGPSNPTVGP